MRTRSLIFGLLLVGGMCSPVFGDGKYFRHVRIADQPNITAQRALIVYKDGRETLIVQSEIDRGAESMGWVLPLPSPPDTIEACHPNTLAALWKLLTPELRSEYKRFLVLGVLVFVLVVLVCAMRLLQNGDKELSAGQIIVVIAILAAIATLFLPSLGRNRRFSKGIDVSQPTRAGVYDVRIIQATDARQVTAWLSSNGFAGSPAADAVIADYVADRWCFAVSKVAASDHETVTHHPLRFTFETKRAVYPMRLTGVDAQPIMLDLFVIADQQATSPVLKTWLSDRFLLNDGYGAFHDIQQTAPDVFDGEVFKRRMGLADVSRHMWDGCVVTRLRNRLDARQMQDDLAIGWTAPQPSAAVVYSRAAAMGIAAAAAIMLWVLLIGIGTHLTIKRSWTQDMLMRRYVWPGLAPAIVVGVVIYAGLDVVPTRQSRRDWYRQIIGLSKHRAALASIRKQPVGERFVQAYHELLGGEESDRSKPLEDLAQLGDYHIQESAGGWRLTVLDRDFIPTVVPITSNGSPIFVDTP